MQNNCQVVSTVQKTVSLATRVESLMSKPVHS